jgi:hypothetical protein
VTSTAADGDVNCTGDGACGGKVHCSADDCDVACIGSESCQGSVTCSAGSCTVECENCGCGSSVSCSAARRSCDIGYRCR